MSVNFVAYIDESGDEGFKFEAGSSEWFVLSAAVVRQKQEHQIVPPMQKVRASLGKPPNYITHFRELDHERRVTFVEELSRNNFLRLITVACKKCQLTESEYLREKHRLYFYLVRYAFERISWLCDRHKIAGDGLPKARIVFSNRSGMSYDEIRTYMKQLKRLSETTGDVRVNWEVIDPEMIVAISHKRSAGLQIADAVASSFFYALEKSRFGYTEPRYAKTLLPISYRNGTTLLGYGVKLFPRESHAELSAHADYEWLKK